MIKLFLAAISLIILPRVVLASSDTLNYLSGTVYDEMYRPVPYTHVIGMHSGYGDITDTLGIFIIPAVKGDTLLFRNIAFRDTLIAIEDLLRFSAVHLKSKFYLLPEARVFDWGSTYDDFKNAIIYMPDQESLAEALGLPRQDPDYIPFDMDEKLLKSAAFLVKNPISYLYYNISRMEKSARKVYKLERNKDKIDQFDAIYNVNTVEDITGLKGEDLEEFMVYLNTYFVCNYNCSEFEIISEIHYLWSIYSEHR